MKQKVTVFGSFVVDLMARTPHLPAPAETVKGSFFKQGAGGKGFNQGVAAHKAGGDVAMITKLGRDSMANAALDFRMQGFRDYMAEKAPGLTLTDTEYNDNDSADAQADAENTINAVGADLIGIYAGNNVTCDGVCNALRAANMKEGVVSIGVDSDDVEIAALRDGFLSAIIVQDAFTQGYKCMENAILTLVNGQNPETTKQVNCPPVVVNMENIDSEEIQFMMSPYVK